MTDDDVTDVPDAYCEPFQLPRSKLSASVRDDGEMALIYNPAGERALGVAKPTVERLHAEMEKRTYFDVDND